MRYIFLGLILISFVGCASSGDRAPASFGAGVTTDSYGQEDLDSGNTARGAAWVDMFPRKPMPSRPNWEPIEFFYKHCSGVSPGVHWKHTEYDCSGPY